MFGRNAVVALCAVGLIAGCTPAVKHLVPGSPLDGQKVEVQEFAVKGAAVSNYDAPTDTLGMEVAQKIAKLLREGGVDARAIPSGGPPMAKIIVEGQVTEIDGGSRALRWISSGGGVFGGGGFGAGSARFAVRGKVRRADGEVLRVFADERWSEPGFFGYIFGGDTETIMHECVDTVALDIANIITTGDKFSQ